MKNHVAIEYWIKSSDEDYKTAEALLSLNRFSHALFFCHLAIEKMLKALVVIKTNDDSPFAHNLLRLSELTGISFSKEQLDLMDEINTFNIKARYDDYKFEFYKKATKEYSEKYFKQTTNLHIWLKQQAN